MPPEAELTPPVQKENPAIVAGGPTEGASLNPPVERSAPVLPPVDKKIYLGGKVFNTMEEVNAYTTGLQAKADIADRFKDVIAPPQRVIDPMETIGETFFSDPAGAAKNLIQIAEDNALAKFDNRQRASDLRQKFFNDYSDLRGQEDLVEFYYGKLQKELAQMPEADATSKLANAVRSRLANIKGTQEGTQELSNKAPVTVGTGTSAPAAQAPYVGKSMSEQLREFQSRGKKTAR